MKMDLTGLIYSIFSIAITSLATPLWAFIWVMTLIVGYVQCQWRKWKGYSHPKAENRVKVNPLIYTPEYCRLIFQMAGKSICSERKCLNFASVPVIAIFSTVNALEKVPGCVYVMQGHSFNAVFSRQLTHQRGKHQLYLLTNMN